jgi:hypothetical protein
LVQFFHLGNRLFGKSIQIVQEIYNLGSGPALDVLGGASFSSVLPLLCEFQRENGEGSIELILYDWKSRSFEPFLPIYLGKILVPREISQKISPEIFRRQALEFVLLDIILEKSLEILDPNEILQIKEEIESFLVRNATERIIRVNTGQIGNEVGELIIGTELFDGIDEIVVTQDGTELSLFLSVHSTVDLSFREHRESFVEPEMFPSFVGD